MSAATMGAGSRREFSAVSVGEVLPAKTVHIDRARLVQYAGASLDRNPIHWDERFAVKVGLPNVIAHGMFTMGAAVTVVTDWAGDAGAVVRYGTRFTKPVVVPYETGADVVFSATVTALDEATRQATVEISALCGTDKVLGRATALVQLA
ncbi:MAG: MaoC family dehydratase N-terminal domain-containing protein [Actinomycetales bacterium]|jgi:acyl dehydratase|uniref:MaoC family dehydratase N-terminal domain-containing protein n=1 Tax=Candidatus Phosphoribacter hodrii TaxID=2953743 RepID=A0A934X2E4_9MICO|nr:MaoC family dehydratase N-terminal domain-containing protein [Candidatus Phosphoribacter hodrii]OPZ54624.1 MAG: MaoC like domain protein [bacterium ADurb.BinA028]HNV14537.1 MaoC/PaaZ C-terminal domain-containing protein [Dermatophilaceae bacterium]MBK7273654.1 MaoC family dehydratase N-terminal domain-containing protein [Candidatus Phosphoribacter hodrii]HOA03445.1 MaoC/PaaZ C-terminal domain-containing protein [Dermatophilaceae bacterium]